MKNLFKIILVSLTSLSSLLFLNTKQNDLSLKEDTTDVFNNTNSLKKISGQSMNEDLEVKYSKIFVQYGSDGTYEYLRFATAVTDGAETIKYTRHLEDLEDKKINHKDVNILYKSISSGDQYYYYDGSKLTDNAEEGTAYYWACYTIKFESENYKNSLIDMTITINEKEVNTITTSLTEQKALIPHGIQITKQPARTTYIVGETFKTNGMEVSTIGEEGEIISEVEEYQVSPQRPLTREDTQVEITYKSFKAIIPIKVGEGQIIEAEDGTLKGGEIAKTGMIAPMASNNAFVRNFKNGDSLTFELQMETGKKADLIFIGSSSWTEEYVNSVPRITKDMQANTLFNVEVNGSEIEISDDCVFKGDTLEEASWKLFANWSDVQLNQVTLPKGKNKIEFKFKNSMYINNNDGGTASPFYDQLMIIYTDDYEGPSLPDTELHQVKIEAENAEIAKATKAGDKTLHPDYANSGVANNFSNSAFVKDIKQDGYMKFDITTNVAVEAEVKLFASSTTINQTIQANTLFGLKINGVEITIPNTVKLEASSIAWKVLDMNFGKHALLNGKNEIVFTFKTNSTALFIDYVLVEYNA